MSARSVTAGLAAAVSCCFLAVSATPAAAQGSVSGGFTPAGPGDIVRHPVNHATFVIGWKNHVIHVDPVGGANPAVKRRERSS